MKRINIVFVSIIQNMLIL